MTGGFEWCSIWLRISRLLAGDELDNLLGNRMIVESNEEGS